MSNAVPVDPIFRTLTREVWIVTASGDGRRGGLAATWFSPVSLDPARPAVLVAIAPNHFTRKLIDASGAFAAHLLRPGQFDLAWNFCSDSGAVRDKLDRVPHGPGVTGSPVLSDALSWLECRVTRRLAGGERVYYWAQVVASGRAAGDGPPLTDRELFARLTPEQREHLKANLLADVETLKPYSTSAWRLEDVS